MFRWGVIVAALLVIGSSFFVGLAAVLPWLGYALAPVHKAGRSQRDQVAPRLNLKRRSFRPASKASRRGSRRSAIRPTYRGSHAGSKLRTADCTTADDLDQIDGPANRGKTRSTPSPKLICGR